MASELAGGNGVYREPEAPGIKWADRLGTGSGAGVGVVESTRYTFILPKKRYGIVIESLFSGQDR